MALLDTLTSVAKIATQVANPELMTETIKANAEALDLSRENLRLHLRVSELERLLQEATAKKDLARSVYRLGGFAFKDGDPDPHCPACWDGAQRLIHVVPTQAFYPLCPICKSMIFTDPPKNPSRNDPNAING
jgi:hypothetical protein